MLLIESAITQYTPKMLNIKIPQDLGLFSVEIGEKQTSSIDNWYLSFFHIVQSHHISCNASHIQKSILVE